MHLQKGFYVPLSLRHPLLPVTTVVPNSYTSDAQPQKTNIHILTGFNCSGKTIYIKQVG